MLPDTLMAVPVAFAINTEFIIITHANSGSCSNYHGKYEDESRGKAQRQEASPLGVGPVLHEHKAVFAINPVIVLVLLLRRHPQRQQALTSSVDAA